MVAKDSKKESKGQKGNQIQTGSLVPNQGPNLVILSDLEIQNKESKQSKVAISGSTPNKDAINNGSDNFGKSPNMGLVKAIKNIPSRTQKKISLLLPLVLRK